MLADFNHNQIMVNATMHISGVLVHVQPDHLLPLMDRISTLDGMEVHACDKEGRLVITVEKDDEKMAADAFEQLNQLPGVLSATMIYHHFEPESDAQ